jgi:hypothetical protein
MNAMNATVIRLAVKIKTIVIVVIAVLILGFLITALLFSYRANLGFVLVGGGLCVVGLYLCFNDALESLDSFIHKSIFGLLFLFSGLGIGAAGFTRNRNDFLAIIQLFVVIAVIIFIFACLGLIVLYIRNNATKETSDETPTEDA